MRKVAIVVATLLAAAFGGLPQATAEPTGFDLQSHRGGRGETTEESLRAFAKSLAYRRIVIFHALPVLTIMRPVGGMGAIAVDWPVDVDAARSPANSTAPPAAIRHPAAQ